MGTQLKFISIPKNKNKNLYNQFAIVVIATHNHIKMNNINFK